MCGERFVRLWPNNIQEKRAVELLAWIIYFSSIRAYVNNRIYSTYVDKPRQCGCERVASYRCTSKWYVEAYVCPCVCRLGQGVEKAKERSYRYECYVQYTSFSQFLRVLNTDNNNNTTETTYRHEIEAINSIGAIECLLARRALNKTRNILRKFMSRRTFTGNSCLKVSHRRFVLCVCVCVLSWHTDRKLEVALFPAEPKKVN